jgi:hypothetical protein
MRHVLYTDRNGYTRRALIRDEDGDEMASSGIPAGPPNLEDIDWEAIKREINQQFVSLGIFTWDDVQHSSVGLQAICTVVKRHVAASFRQDQANLRKSMGGRK